MQLRNVFLARKRRWIVFTHLNDGSIDNRVEWQTVYHREYFPVFCLPPKRNHIPQNNIIVVAAFSRGSCNLGVDSDCGALVYAAPMSVQLRPQPSTVKEQQH